MKKIELSKGVIQYTFEPIGDERYSNNVIAIVSGEKAILIDTGYFNQTEEVEGDLKEAGIYIEGVIVSHFHKSHMGGLKRLKDIAIYGSLCYQQTLNQWMPSEEQKDYIPTVKIDKNHRIIFGEHVLELIHNPGHSLCTLFIKIDEQFLYIADELMYAADGNPLLPSVSKDDIINHYVSVHNLTKYMKYSFIPGHGVVIAEPTQRERDIKNVCHYLCEVLSHDEEITVDQAIKNCTCYFHHREWHDNVYK